MLADTAIAVHPDDDRYTRLVGETAILPLVGRRLKIIADPYVKPEFGTGALKITPGHDPNDFEIGRAHGLEEISVIGEDGRMTAAAGERFEGMTRARGARGGRRRAARGGPDRAHRALHAQRAVLAPLRRADRAADLAAVVHAHGRARRAGARARARRPRCRSSPRASARRYVEWLENIRPWCVSRQLWWGHQIPVYYRGEETYAGLEPPEGEGWERDPDVLDTWFSSQLWPFATLGWPDDTPQLRAFYPTDVLSTARDILFLWVARMVMMGLEFTGEIPFSRVNVHTVIQAPDGRRMSKSLGTGIDPMQLIEGGPRPPVFAEGGDFPAYGADAVRWGLLAISSSQDVRFNEERVAAGPPARQQALQRQPARAAAPARGRVGCPTRAPAPATVEDALDPLAPAGRRARRRARRSTTSTSTWPRCGSTTSSTASCATGTSS